MLCRVLQVTRSAFYQWLGRTKSATQNKQETIVKEIERIHRLPRHQDYGSPRMHQTLRQNGIRVSLNTVAKLMKQAGIRARRTPRRRVRTTDSGHDFPIAPNRLEQRFTASRPNQVWLTDFTYLPLDEGFTYLCTMEDLCSRKIVGWAVSRKIDAQLALAALDQAIALRQPPAGLVVHSDRGSQYASSAFRHRLQQCGFLQSMSRKGNAYDNAPMESFFKSFKVEEVHHRRYHTHEEAARAVADYIDRFYNPIRLHSALGYVSPNEFEREQLFENRVRSEICLRRSHSSVARQNLATDNGDREADFKPAFVGEFRESQSTPLLIP